MTPEFEIIDKETIANLHFPATDVLDDHQAILKRESELKRALSLGNLEHTKIKIYFEDNISKKIVETTIWGVTDNSIILKQGVGIPIHRIYKSI